jgi:hypothetical protein
VLRPGGPDIRGDAFVAIYAKCRDIFSKQSLVVSCVRIMADFAISFCGIMHQLLGGELDVDGDMATKTELRAICAQEFPIW